MCSKTNWNRKTKTMSKYIFQGNLSQGNAFLKRKPITQNAWSQHQINWPELRSSESKCKRGRKSIFHVLDYQPCLLVLKLIFNSNAKFRTIYFQIWQFQLGMMMTLVTDEEGEEATSRLIASTSLVSTWPTPTNTVGNPWDALRETGMMPVMILKAGKVMCRRNKQRNF